MLIFIILAKGSSISSDNYHNFKVAMRIIDILICLQQARNMIWKHTLDSVGVKVTCAADVTVVGWLHL